VIDGVAWLKDNSFKSNLPVQIRIDGKDTPFASIKTCDIIGSPIMKEMRGKGYNIGIVVGADADAVINWCNIYRHKKPRGPRFVTRAGVWRLEENAVAEIDATNCWWGHESGPESRDNPEGKGERVFGRVRTKPFLKEPVKR
jgi:hypothetical protein